MSYEIFAGFYDSLMENAEYDKRADYYQQILADNGIKSGILADLGCGTGSMSIRMHNKGFDVIGTDPGIGMLMQARQKTAGTDILLLNQSMEELDLYGTIDCAISTLDCINHLESRENVLTAFGKVSLFMNKGGIFAFDVNTVFKHRNKLADNAYIFENDKVFCAWQNSLNDDDSVDITLDFFEDDGGTYYRETECFTERAYPLEELKQMLEETGFTVKNIYDDMTFSPVKEDSERAVFVAEKR